MTNTGDAASTASSERPDGHELRSICERLAVGAGRLALEGRRSLGVGQHVEHHTKSSATDPVTEFDRAAEQLLVDELIRSRPADAIVGEEGTDRSGTTGLAWFLDPIDGTVNFVYDLPTWSVSVAVADPVGPLAGAVHVPVTGELFSAHRGGGATLDGRPIAPSTVTDLSLALVTTGFNYDPEVRLLQAERLTGILGRVRDIRRFGSAALDLCLVACGRVDAYFEERLNAWDVAAGGLIADEAGARTSDFGGGAARPEEIVAAAPGVHDGLLSLLGDTAA